MRNVAVIALVVGALLCAGAGVAAAPPGINGPLLSTAPPPAPRIAFFGDSITDDAPYPLLVCQTLGARRVNQHQGDPNRAAIGGTALMDIPGWGPPGVATFAERIAPFPVDDLVILYGANDLDAMAVDPAEFTLDTWRAAWESLDRQIAALPVPPDETVVVGLPYLAESALAGYPAPPWMGSAAHGRDLMDGVTRDEAARHGQVYVPLDGMDASLSLDGKHPNRRGQEYIARAILSAL